MKCELLAPSRGKAGDDHVFINLKRHAISVAINTFTVYTFDLRGRLMTAVRDRHTFRRSLDNRVMEKWSIVNGGGRRRLRIWLDRSASKALVDSIIQQVRTLHRAVERGQVQPYSGTDLPRESEVQDLLDGLAKILHYDFQALEADAEVFRSIYRPVGILPPDLYLSLVLQATEGCSYNRCSFCDFYKSQSFRVKSPPEFRRHIREVISWFGPALRLRRSVFLGEANALDLAMAKLLPLLRIAASEIAATREKTSSGHCLDGFYGFMSGFGSRKSGDDFEELRAGGMRRIYIGLESGSPDLLSFLNKPTAVERILELVAGCRQADIGVGVIVLLGAGGTRFQASHIRDTVAAVREMKLGGGDMIYFSPVLEEAGAAYLQKMVDEEITPLTPSDILDQKREMLAGMLVATDRTGPKVATYDIDEFIY